MAPLKEGSPVILGGALTVGSVTHVEIHQIEPTAQSGRKHPETVFAVRAEISPDVPLYGGCKITTDQPAIGGSGSVSILHVGVPGRELEQPIHGLPPQSLAAAISTLSRELLKEGGLVSQLNKAVDPEAPGSVLHKVLRSLDDVNAITASLRTEMNDNEQKALLGKIHASLDDLNGMTHILRGQMRPDNDAALLGKVHVALDHLAEGLSEAVATLKEDRPLVREALTSVRDVARSLDTELVASLRRELDSADKTSLLGKVHTGMDRVNAALADLKSIASTGQRVVTVSQPTLERTMQNFKDMSEQLRLASQEVLLNPSKLIWGPDARREEQMLVFQAARSFAEAARELDSATGRLEAVLHTLPPDGAVPEKAQAELRSISDGVRAAFERFELAETTLWDKLKEGM